jgi:hypothetical protein
MKPTVAGSLPDSWLGQNIEVEFLPQHTTIRGRLLAVSPVRHDVTLTIGESEAKSIRVTVGSDFPVIKAP